MQQIVLRLDAVAFQSLEGGELEQHGGVVDQSVAVAINRLFVGAGCRMQPVIERLDIIVLFLLGNQGVLDLLNGVDDGFAIGRKPLINYGASTLNLCLAAATVKDRAGHAGGQIGNPVIEDIGDLSVGISA